MLRSEWGNTAVTANPATLYYLGSDTELAVERGSTFLFRFWSAWRLMIVAFISLADDEKYV